MPKAHAYIRCSHEDSAESGLGLEAQEENCQRYYHMLKGRHPDLEWAGMVVDAAVSAYRKPLLQREGGARLGLKVRKGDHILFARLDRGFRLVPDFYNTYQMWENMGITIHFVDQQLDLSTAIGKFFAGMMAVIAQWQSDYISERTREGLARSKKRGGPGGSTTPLGKKRVKIQKQILQIEDREKEVIFRYVLLLARKGVNMEQIGHRLEDIHAKREHRPFEKLMSKRYWRRQVVRKYLIAAIEWEKKRYAKD